MTKSPERAWFRWRFVHPALAEDPRAAFAAGWRLCNEQLLDSSAQWVQLGPLLASLLEELIVLRETRDVEAGLLRDPNGEPMPAQRQLEGVCI